MVPYPPQLDAVERRLVEQYLNVFCRETRIGDPRLIGEPSAGLRPHVDRWRAAGWMPYLLTFARTGCRLAGALTHYSPAGYHRIGPHALLEQDGDWQPLGSATPLADCIAAELAAVCALPTDIAEQRRARLAGLMHDSLDKVRRYHRQSAARPVPAFLAAEQGLRFGHVFHITSKAIEGYGEHDLHRYAPELGASFQLHYFAVSTGLTDARSVSGGCLPIDPEAMQQAADLLENGDYRLLPCHPWQAAYLQRLPEIDALVKSCSLIPLGPLGEVAWPTSSVRTVWLPKQNLFLKLSLDIRITNFIRNNPPEHVARALDASYAWSLLPEAAGAQPAFTVLPELGAKTLKVDNAALRAACGVVYRQGLPGGAAEQARVMAAVLEEPAEGEMPLLTLLRQAGAGHEPDEALIRRWWSRYLDVTLLPLLQLYSRYGVSLEAHLQNTLVGFAGGWPVHGYARDMEGTSLSRTRFPYAERLRPDSPALYDEAQTWQRFQYYVLVNHVSHVVACLARTGLVSEARLWRDTAERLTALDDEWAQRLFTLSTLPAKANLLSSFHEHGEHPAWIDLPNPLRQRASSCA